MNGPAVFFEDVSYKIGGRSILEHINFSIGKGYIHGLLGPNGAGKTSILSIILGLRRHYEGRVSLLGEVLPGRGKELRRRIGAVLQETALYEELTAYENLLFSASLYGINKPKSRISEVLGILGLESRSCEAVRTLSGGMRRRITIARALLHKPDLLVIDEPTLGVDAQARHAIWTHLRGLKKEGITILAATNYIDEAQALCDNVSVVGSGKIIVTENPGKLISRAGSCVDIECSPGVSGHVMSMLEKSEEINRMEITPGGLSVFIKEGTRAEKLVMDIMKNSQVSGFRIRPPDLSEVFTMLETPS
jgi:ABC-type multidrug transport system ATPase subunit